MTRRWFSLILAPIPFLLGCAQDPVIPKIGADPIVLTMAFSTKTFIIGKPDTISVTATSSFEQAAIIRFDTDCQILVTIRSAAGTAVVPPNGRPTCIPLESTLTVPALGSVTRRFVWTGNDRFLPAGSTTVLPAGTYFISAAINALNYSTLAAAVKVDLVDPPK